MLVQLVLLIILQSEKSSSWDLSPLNIPDDHRILHVSIYCNRAFLCIDQNPSLVEVAWPESITAIPVKKFTPRESDFRPRLVCDEIVRARSTDIDRFGNLWVLDNAGQVGNYECLPKLSIHSLVFLNERIHVKEFLEFKHFESIVLDPLGADEPDVRAYITFKNQRYIMIYSLKEKKYAKIKFESNDVMLPRPVLTDVALLKSDKMLLLDRNHGHLYTTQITSLRHSPLASLEGQTYRSQTLQFLMPLNYIGELLGRARSLSIHPKGQIFYILDRDGAVMVWNRKLPLNAENHRVVYQTWRNISGIVFGWRGSVWVVFDKPKKNKFHCAKVNFFDR